MKHKGPILITGAGGFIGYHLIKQLTELRINTVGLDILPQPATQKSRYLKWVETDVEDPDAIKNPTKSARGIIHLAGMSRLGQGYSNPAECMMANTMGALNILEEARKSALRPWIILGSTREVNDLRVPTGHVFYQNARGVYGLSKLCAELLAERYAKDFGMKILSLRLSDVYGAPRDNTDRVLPKFILQALKGEAIFVTNGPHQRDFTHHRDVVDGFLSAMKILEECPKGYYNVATICTGKATSLPELARLIVEITGSKSQINVQEETEQDTIRNSQLNNDTRRARELLDFKAKISLEKGIEETIEILKKQERST